MSDKRPYKMSKSEAIKYAYRLEKILYRLKNDLLRKMPEEVLTEMGREVYFDRKNAERLMGATEFWVRLSNKFEQQLEEDTDDEIKDFRWYLRGLRLDLTEMAEVED